MKAIVYTSYGGPEVLRYTDVERPAIGDTDVLVRVRASSINFGDRVYLRGTPRIARLVFGVRRPKATILGRDVAGQVEAVGAKVTTWRVGDEVFGEMNQGGFAEYVAAPADHLAAKPAGVSFEQAATLPVAGTTALQQLRAAEVRPGQTVLVNGGSGGVGTFTVRLAKVLGARVVAVCSTRNVELVRSIGADHVIDYTREDVTAGPDRFDVIVDLAGNHPLARWRQILTPDGVYVFCSGNGGTVLGPIPRMIANAATARWRKVDLRSKSTQRSSDDLSYLAGLVAAGELSPVIERTYPMSEAAEAFRVFEAEHARGKTVLIG